MTRRVVTCQACLAVPFPIVYPGDMGNNHRIFTPQPVIAPQVIEFGSLLDDDLKRHCNMPIAALPEPMRTLFGYLHKQEAMAIQCLRNQRRILELLEAKPDGTSIHPGE